MVPAQVSVPEHLYFDIEFGLVLIFVPYISYE